MEEDRGRVRGHLGDICYSTVDLMNLAVSAVAVCLLTASVCPSLPQHSNPPLHPLHQSLTSAPALVPVSAASSTSVASLETQT